MKNEHKVISSKYLPARPPMMVTAVVWLVLDRTQAPEWAWGVAATLLFIIWVAQIYSIVVEKYHAPLFGGEE